MSDNDLLVMVPTRGRRAQCERLLKSFTETATCADLLFITDPDDDSYEGMDWGEAVSAVLEPRAYLTGKLNQTALAMADLYSVLMWAGDDHVFRTPGWDRLMLDTLKGMGRCAKCGPDGTALGFECPGHGWVYPDDKRRIDVPEIWMMSSDVVKTLGYFANPAMSHYYIDNATAELAKRAGLIRYCPEAIVQHMHYQVEPSTVRDETYLVTEDMFGQPDLAAFKQWQADRLPVEVAILRREYNPDVSWVLSKIS